MKIGAICGVFSGLTFFSLSQMYEYKQRQMDRSLEQMYSQAGKNIYYTQPFKIEILDKKDMAKLYKEKTGKYEPAILGFCLIDKREIYVPFANYKDKHGKRLPNFAILGHEIWHLDDIAGEFHGEEKI